MVAAVAVCGCLASCAGHTSGSANPASTVQSRSSSSRPAAVVVPPPAPSTTIDSGSLPQTRVLPTTTDPAFVAGQAALWSAIVHDDAALATSFFFPLSAYLQVKAIAHPDADWHQRLLAAYQRDIHTMHEQLAGYGSPATFRGLSIPTARATWVLPGQEYNRIGYWRVFGDALHFQVGSVEHTFPIYSLISWRGEWYVVHVAPP